MGPKYIVRGCQLDENDEDVTRYKDIRSAFTDFTSTHGIPHITRASGLVKKAVWILVTFTCLAGLVYNFYSITITYRSFPVYVHSTIKQAQGINFPSVSVCNTNPVKLSAITQNDRLQALLASWESAKKRRRRDVTDELGEPDFQEERNVIETSLTKWHGAKKHRRKRQSSSCPHPTHNDVCYWRQCESTSGWGSSCKKNYDDAASACQTEGGILAVVDTQAKQDHIANILDLDSNSYQTLWIDLVYDNSNSDWVWSGSDLLASDWSYWESDPGNPSDDACVCMTQSKWEPNDCEIAQSWSSSAFWGCDPLCQDGRPYIPEVETTTVVETTTSEITTLPETTTSELTTLPETTTIEITTQAETTTSEITTLPETTTSEITTLPATTTIEITTQAETTTSEITTLPETTTSEITTLPATTTIEITTQAETTTSEITTLPETTTSEITTLPATTTIEITTQAETTTSEITTLPETTTSEITTLPDTTTSEITTLSETTTSEITTLPATTTIEMTTQAETSTVAETSTLPTTSPTQPTTTTTYYSEYTEREPPREDFQRESDFMEVLADISLEEKKSMGYNYPEFILECVYNGIQCSESNFEHFFDASHGNCYIFNSGWNESQPVKTSSYTGRTKGLHLYLDLGQSEYIASVSQGAGAIVVVNNQSNMPFPSDQGILAPPGYITSIGIRKLEVHRLGDQYGDCVVKQTQGTEKNMFFDEHPVEYSFSACEKTCYQKNVIETCGCADPQYPIVSQAFGDVTVSACDARNQIQDDCVYGLTLLFIQDELNCNCELPCSNEYFAHSISKILWPSDKERDTFVDTYLPDHYANTTIDEDYIKRNFLKLEVYFEELSAQYMEEKPKYNFGRYISDVGSIIGLWIGCSVLSILEFLELGLDTVVYSIAYCKKRKKNISDSMTSLLSRSSKRKVSPAGLPTDNKVFVQTLEEKPSSKVIWSRRRVRSRMKSETSFQVDNFWSIPPSTPAKTSPLSPGSSRSASKNSADEGYGSRQSSFTNNGTGKNNKSPQSPQYKKFVFGDS